MNMPGGAKDAATLPPALRIAVLLPCYNEAEAIAQTVNGFAAALPTAKIYVYDNNSIDGSREIAAGAGAIVRSVRQQGKGHVVRRMFAAVDSDIYVIHPQSTRLNFSHVLAAIMPTSASQKTK